MMQLIVPVIKILIAISFVNSPDSQSSCNIPPTKRQINPLPKDVGKNPKYLRIGLNLNSAEDNKTPKKIR